MIGRRDFITLLGGAAAAWPLAARAQKPAVPVIGFLSVGRLDALTDSIAAFRTGLNEGGFVEGKNVTIDYRWEEGQDDRLPALAAELARRPVAAILASGGQRPTRAAQAATSTIPIVFTIQTDPVAVGLVASLNRPGGNLTGVYSLANELVTKQLGLILELVPSARRIALLVNPDSPGASLVPGQIQGPVRSLGLELAILRARNERDLDEVSATLGQQRPDALLIQADLFLLNRSAQIAAMAEQHAVPSIATTRVFPAAGGLMSYGANSPVLYRQAGLYVGRILRGDKVTDLPVVQATKFDLVINLKTAKALGLQVPASMQQVADEVIE
jgi:putative ABC transport system substrate-binding protein